jgi:hypothetical protein
MLKCVWHTCLWSTLLLTFSFVLSKGKAILMPKQHNTACYIWVCWLQLEVSHSSYLISLVMLWMLIQNIVSVFQNDCQIIIQYHFHQGGLFYDKAFCILPQVLNVFPFLLSRSPLLGHPTWTWWPDIGGWGGAWQHKIKQGCRFLHHHINFKNLSGTLKNTGKQPW